MESEEFHGIFQFLELDFETKERKAIEIDRNYRPKEVNFGHFAEVENEPKTSFIEYLYYKKQYSKCLECCNSWLVKNSRKKRQIKSGEIIDIAIRCCLKLGDLKSAFEYSEQFGKNTESPVLYLKGQVCSMNKKYNHSITFFRKYLEGRPNDYTVWVEIGRALKSASDHFSCLELQNWASAAFKLALHLITNSERIETEFSRYHSDRIINCIRHELAQLTDFRQSVDSLDILSLDIENLSWLNDELAETKNF
jgi:tetratricopeptide (TPR) repeat protein